MSLLSEAMTPCVYINKAKVDDGYGAHKTVYTEGATLNCAIVKNTSLQAKVAMKDGVTDIYTVTTSKAYNLQFHDIIKRLSDGKILRITSNGDDGKTPESAGLDMRQVSAEEWEIKDDE